MDNFKKLFAEQRTKGAQFNTRRHFLKDCTLGLGGLALGSLINSCTNDNSKISPYTIDRSLNPMSAMPASLFAKGKKVLFTSIWSVHLPN